MRLTARVVAGYGIAKVAPGAITFVAVPLVVHAVGARQYGLFSTVWALTVFATSLFGGWVRAATLRASGYPQEAVEALPRWVIAVTAMLPAVPVAGWAALMSGRHPGLGAVPFMTAAVAFAVANGLYPHFATKTQRDGAAGRFATAETLRAGCGLGLSVGLDLTGVLTGATAVLIAYAVGTMIATGVCARGRRYRLARMMEVRSDLLARYWRYGWPMSLWSAAMIGSLYVDRFIVTAVLGPDVAGRYAAVADLVTRGAAVVASPILMAVHPAIMADWNNDRRDRALAVLRRSALVVTGVTVVMVIAAAGVGPAVLDLVLPGAPPEALLVGGLALGAGVWQIANFAHKPYEFVARNREMLAVALLTMVGAAALSAVLITMIGVLGAVVATCCGGIAYTAVCLFRGSRMLQEERSDRQSLVGVTTKWVTS